MKQFDDKVVGTNQKGDITIVYKYNGCALCCGHLLVIFNGQYLNERWSISTTGRIDSDWNVIKGPWVLEDWPKEFPENRVEELTDLINETIPYGCCGGCC